MERQIETFFIGDSDLKRIRNLDIDKFSKMKIVSCMCRINALSAITNAGSGHIGSSFSSMDIMTYVYFEKIIKVPFGENRNIFFSSKGHDCPAQYSVLAACGIIGVEDLQKLRRISGLEGHPEITTVGIETNTGSLGMGISKGKGFAIAKMLRNRSGEIYVLTGDGELQEGQIWESMQNTSHQKIRNMTVIVDCNNFQTDMNTSRIISLGILTTKFESFGWYVDECDGHNFESIDAAFKRTESITNRPKIIIAHTIKGKGVSFMEAMNNVIYRWHSGAPDEASYLNAFQELSDSLAKIALTVPIGTIEFDKVSREYREKTPSSILEEFSRSLLDLGERNRNVVVLDADLAADCGLRKFDIAYPERFIENGIAEQDMVSTAGGLALCGFIPVVNSFGSFLLSRANEQIFNNATEGKKIIYVSHLAGLIPAGPGRSHQGVRDISLVYALPNIVVIEPCNAEETRRAMEWCIESCGQSVMIRISSAKSPMVITLPKDYAFVLGSGTTIREGDDGIVFAYGPVMLGEALIAAKILAEKFTLNLKIVNMPWLNRVDLEWLEDVISDTKHVFVVDDHSIRGGLGDTMLNAFNNSNKLLGTKLHKIGIRGYPVCGEASEVLRFHQMDGECIASHIKAYYIRFGNTYIK